MHLKSPDLWCSLSCCDGNFFPIRMWNLGETWMCSSHHGHSHLTAEIVPCEGRVELFFVTVPRWQLRTSLQLCMAQGCCVHSSCKLLEGCLRSKYISHKCLSSANAPQISSTPWSSLAGQAWKTHLLICKASVKMKRVYFTTKLGALTTIHQAPPWKWL